MNILIKSGTNYNNILIKCTVSEHRTSSIITLYLLFTLEYRLISKKGEGTFSEVLKAQSIKTGKYVAIKCMKSHFDSIEQVSLKSTSPYCVFSKNRSTI